MHVPKINNIILSMKIKNRDIYRSIRKRTDKYEEVFEPKKGKGKKYSKKDRRALREYDIDEE